MPDLAKTRHDLRNVAGQILGFGELLLEEARDSRYSRLHPQLETIHRTAMQMLSLVEQGLCDSRMKEGLADNVSSLSNRLSESARVIAECAEALHTGANDFPSESFRADLARIVGTARKARDLVRASLDVETAQSADGSVAGNRCVPEGCGDSCPELEIGAGGTPAMLSAESIAQGTILVVDDLEENRDLLHRRLSRLGYAVRMADNGQSALEATATQQPLDLILLDIMMPGLNGIDVLHRLKASPATQHIPVIMLSSADQIETVVRCIKLGADDFLAKPFNETLLMARIESSLSKKRLRDQESAFLRRLQIEQETSERLLLNILPKPIAERLKQGEKIIADSFADATVLFSDFVNFTHLSSDTPPKELVGNLNEIFSAFDYLCEQQGLEKIKTIGDGYMAVSGVPTPNPDHAEAAAKLALAMQAETAGFAERVKQPFQIRIGLNSGPVVAGVIGARKFAYDLWGDNVNIAKHMEASAPPGGILVAQATYERLRDRHAFQPAQLVRVKGGVEMATYLLTP